MSAATKTRKARWLSPERALLLLLVFVVLAPISHALHWGGIATFAFAALAIIPLAGLMGEATENLAARLGAGVGGLLNALQVVGKRIEDGFEQLIELLAAGSVHQRIVERIAGSASNLIQRINRAEVSDLKTFGEIAGALKTGDAVVLHVLSNNRSGRGLQPKIVQFTVQ